MDIKTQETCDEDLLNQKLSELSSVKKALELYGSGKWLLQDACDTCGVDPNSVTRFLMGKFDFAAGGKKTCECVMLEDVPAVCKTHFEEFYIHAFYGVALTESEALTMIPPDAKETVAAILLDNYGGCFLEERQIRILKMRLLENVTLRDTAEAIGLSVERTRQIENVAASRMRLYKKLLLQLGLHKYKEYVSEMEEKTEAAIMKDIEKKSAQEKRDHVARLLLRNGERVPRESLIELAGIYTLHDITLFGVREFLSTRTRNALDRVGHFYSLGDIADKFPNASELPFGKKSAEEVMYVLNFFDEDYK